MGCTALPIDSSFSGVLKSGKNSISGVEGILSFDGFICVKEFSIQKIEKDLRALTLNLRSSGVVNILLISCELVLLALSSDELHVVLDETFEAKREYCCLRYCGEYELNEPKRGESSVSSVSSPPPSS